MALALGVLVLGSTAAAAQVPAVPMSPTTAALPALLPDLSADLSDLLDEPDAVLPSVQPSVDPGEILPTPPDGALPGELNDVIIGPLPDLGGLLGEPSPGTSPSGNGEGGSTGGGNGGSTSGGSTSGGSSNGSGSGTEGGSEGGRATTEDGRPVATRVPYISTTGRAAVAALSRAVDLMGPFAAPLILALAAMGVLIGLSRGSTRLVKLERANIFRQTYKL